MRFKYSERAWLPLWLVALVLWFCIMLVSKDAGTSWSFLDAYFAMLGILWFCIMLIAFLVDLFVREGAR